MLVGGYGSLMGTSSGEVAVASWPHGGGMVACQPGGRRGSGALAGGRPCLEREKIIYACGFLSQN